MSDHATALSGTCSGRFLPEGRLCAWGGSLVIVDVDRRMTFAYVMNKMAMGMPGPIVAALVERAYDIVNR